MRDIENAAEEVGTKLVLGKEVHLHERDQAILASFIGQSALLIDLLGRLGHRIPQRDFDYFYANKAPPPHWYIGIGHFVEWPRISVDISASDSSTGDEITSHSISTTLGSLFTATQFFHPPGPPEIVALPIQINRPHLTSIFPHLHEPIRFPSPLFPISGGLWQDGGLARDLSRRFSHAAYGLLTRAPKRP